MGFSEFDYLFESTRRVEENSSEWLIRDITNYRSKYGYENWAESIERYSEHMGVSEDMLRDVLVEAKIIEQDDEEDIPVDLDDEPEELDEPDVPEDDIETEDAPFEDDEDVVPTPTEKEYLGKSDDTHYYMFPVTNDMGQLTELQILDQEESVKFSSKEHGIEPTDVVGFIDTVLRDVEIAEIDRGIVLKYILPPLEKKYEEEEEFIEGAEGPADDEEPIESKVEESEINEPAGFNSCVESGGKVRTITGPNKEHGLKECEYVKYCYLDNKSYRGEVKTKKNESNSMKESKMNEMKVDFEGHTFDVYLEDSGTMDTVISINGKEFTFDSEFASMFRDEDTGEMTSEGLEELALDALSTIEPEEWDELTADDEPEDLDEEEPDVPDEEDMVFSSTGTLGGKTQVSVGGKVVGTFTEWDDAEQAAKDWMEKNNWHPNVWIESDHGNYHRTTLGEAKELDSNVPVGEAGNSNNMLDHPRFGKVELVRIDKDTYSIPMAIVRLADGEEICRPYGEFKAGDIEETKATDEFDAVHKFILSASEDQLKNLYRELVVYSLPEELLRDHLIDWIAQDVDSDDVHNAWVLIGTYGEAFECKAPQDSDPEGVLELVGEIEELEEREYSDMVGTVKDVYNVNYVAVDGNQKSTRVMAHSEEEAERMVKKDKDVKAVSNSTKVAEEKKLKENYTYIPEYEAYDRYDEFIDEMDGPVKVMGLEYDPSKVLKEVDPTAYETGFNDWLDSEELTIDEDEAEEEEEEEEEDYDEEDDVEEAKGKKNTKKYTKESKPVKEETSDFDKEINTPFTKLSDLKAQGKDKERGGEYDEVLKQLQQKTRERLGQVTVTKVKEDAASDDYFAKKLLAHLKKMEEQGYELSADEKAMIADLEKKHSAVEGNPCPMPNETKESIEKTEWIFTPNHSNVTDDKNHLPIMNEKQASNAVARVDSYRQPPKWFKGTLESMRKMVVGKVKEKFPNVTIEEKEVKETNPKAKKVVKETKELHDPAYDLARDMLGLIDESIGQSKLEKGMKVQITSNQDMSIIVDEAVIHAINENGVEITGNKNPVDQEWHNFRVCHIYEID